MYPGLVPYDRTKSQLNAYLGQLRAGEASPYDWGGYANMPFDVFQAIGEASGGTDSGPILERLMAYMKSHPKPMTEGGTGPFPEIGVGPLYGQGGDLSRGLVGTGGRYDWMPQTGGYPAVPRYGEIAPPYFGQQWWYDQ